MAANFMKPAGGQWIGGSFGCVPVTQDATPTPIVSPVAAAATSDLIVPPFALRLNLIAVGANGATWRPKLVTTLQGGPVSIPANVVVPIDVAGMSGANPLIPTIIQVIAGAGSPVSFWFDCTEPNGV